jgi:hypothetical protein
VGLETFHAAPFGPVVVPRHLMWEFEHVDQQISVNSRRGRSLRYAAISIAMVSRCGHPSMSD